MDEYEEEQKKASESQVQELNDENRAAADDYLDKQKTLREFPMRIINLTNLSGEKPSKYDE